MGRHSIAFCRLVVVTVVLLCSREKARASTPVDFYRDLAGAIDSAKGRLLFYLHAGHWKTAVGNTFVVWDVDEGTKATAEFQYQSNRLVSAEVTFRPPVHVWLLGRQGVSGALSRVKYDGDGDVVDWDVRPDRESSLNASGQPRLQQHLAFPTKPKELFVGLPFKAASSSARCAPRQQVNCVAAPMVYRVRIESTSTQPGLAIDLKHDYLINFSRPNGPTGYANYVNVDHGTFEFDHVDYDVEERTIDGELVKFDVTALGAQFTSRDVDFALRGGSSVALSNVAFSLGRDRIGTIDAHGEIVGTLAAASELNLTSGLTSASGTPIGSHVAFNSGSVRIVNAQITQLANGRSVIQAGQGSRIDASLLSSRLTVGSDGMFNMKSGEITFKLTSGRWDSESKPVVAGTLSLKNVALGSSRFRLNSVSDVRLSGGSVLAHDLVFNSLETPMITGKFAELVLAVEDHSILGVPNGFVFESAASGSIRAADINRPLEFVHGDDLPRGMVHIDLPFRSLRNASNATFALTGGTAQLDLVRRNDGSFSGTGVDISGLLDLDGGGNHASLRIGLSGTIEKPVNRAARFDGTWSATLPANTSWTFSTPYEHGKEPDERHFSIMIGIGFARDVVLSNVPIKFDGTTFSTQVEKDVVFRVALPSGGGEHEDPERPDAGYSRDQPDEAKGNQEVYTDTFLSPFTCRLHIYLKPRVYEVAARVKLASSDAAPFVLTLPSLKVPSIEWDKDGCEVAEFLANILIRIATWTGVGPSSLQDGIDGIIDKLGRDAIQRWASNVHIEIGKPPGT